MRFKIKQAMRFLGAAAMALTYDSAAWQRFTEGSKSLHFDVTRSHYDMNWPASRGTR